MSTRHLVDPELLPLVAQVRDSGRARAVERVLPMLPGGEDDDQFDFGNLTSARADLDGGSGNDRLDGGSGDDVMMGRAFVPMLVDGLFQHPLAQHRILDLGDLRLGQALVHERLRQRGKVGRVDARLDRAVEVRPQRHGVLAQNVPRLMKAGIAKALAEALPDADAQFLEGKGHMLTYEAPDEVAAAILRS